VWLCTRWDRIYIISWNTYVRICLSPTDAYVDASCTYEHDYMQEEGYHIQTARVVLLNMHVLETVCIVGMRHVVIVCEH
jgi:hypothetical protein